MSALPRPYNNDGVFSYFVGDAYLMKGALIAVGAAEAEAKAGTRGNA
jgi:hypothetical protein